MCVELCVGCGNYCHVCSKWRRHELNSGRLDQYLYGTAGFGLHTLPPGGMISGVDCCDAASSGTCSRARSQGDLCGSTPHWVPSSRHCPPGTYATTLEMRRNGSVPGQYGGGWVVGGYAGPRLAGSQLTLPDLWTTTTPCPVHGSTTYSRRHPAQHIYDMPLLGADTDTAMTPADNTANPTLPFYHELDVQTSPSGLDGIPTPPPRHDDTEPHSAAPFSRI